MGVSHLAEQQQLTLAAAEMIALINKLLDWFKALFWKEEMELTLVGLQYSGKTTFVNVIAVSSELKRVGPLLPRWVMRSAGPDRVRFW